MAKPWTTLRPRSANPIAAELEGVDLEAVGEGIVAPRSGSAGNHWRPRSEVMSLGAGVLLVYAHAGTISMAIPSMFFLCGVTLIGLFAVLSETHFTDRFEDHHLTVCQVVGHVVIQLGFLLAAPEIGYAFLNVLFLIFGVASLQMTPRQAAISWIFTVACVAPIFLFAPIAHRHAFCHDDGASRRGAGASSLRSGNAPSSDCTATRCARSCTSAVPSLPRPTSASKSSPNSTN